MSTGTIEKEEILIDESTDIVVTDAPVPAKTPEPCVNHYFCKNDADYKCKMHCCSRKIYLCEDCLIDTRASQDVIICSNCGMLHATPQCLQVVCRLDS